MRSGQRRGGEAEAAARWIWGDTLGCQGRYAEARALVIHGAWYVSSQMAQDKGKLGRSQGCLAVAGNDLASVLDRLGPGSLIYVDKI